jgi:hypothetical protein
MLQSCPTLCRGSPQLPSTAPNRGSTPSTAGRLGWHPLPERSRGGQVNYSSTSGGGASPKWWEAPGPENVKQIGTVQELVDELVSWKPCRCCIPLIAALIFARHRSALLPAWAQGVGRERLVILDVYATWCNACKSLNPKVWGGEPGEVRSIHPTSLSSPSPPAADAEAHGGEP